jgi:superfamily II DNA/RNA helicase
MKRIELGSKGEPVNPEVPDWGDLKLPPKWFEAMKVLCPHGKPTELQAFALGTFRILESRRNLIISAPTNTGKSLLGYTVLLESVLRGRRALLLEPYRALAQEKLDDLKRVLPSLQESLGQRVSVIITTGDYRLDEETMNSPPPEGGEIVIATPERIEAILRNPEYSGWCESFGAVCADEAHLLSSLRRGPTSEFVLTTFLLQKAPPRLALLSATVGDTSTARDWLQPCDVVATSVRHPPLEQTILSFEDSDDLAQEVVNLCRELLSKKENSVLVFVYQTAAAVRLARALSTELGSLTGEAGALAYHSKMPKAIREKSREAYLSGRSQCLVCTSALAAGVNLPATHVIVRDLTFAGVGPLSVEDLIQMSGRAGRGTRTGHAFFMHRPSDGWQLQELIANLDHPSLRPLGSALATLRGRQTGPKPQGEDFAISASATMLLSLLARGGKDGRTLAELERFVSKTLGGKLIVPKVSKALNWLGAPHRLFAHQNEEGRWAATSLGVATARSTLPLGFASGFGQLTRDLLSLEVEGKVFSEWSFLDHLLVIELLSERKFSLRQFSEPLREQIDNWAERSSEKSVVYREWIRGTKGHSKAAELFGSLQLPLESRATDTDEWCRRNAYLGIFRAIILRERSKGLAVEEISRRWKVQSLAGIEEAWWDDRLWLLNALGGICDLRCFYHHLRTECGASEDRVLRVKRLIQRLRILAYQTASQLKYCSPLGGLLTELRRSQGLKGVGEKTVQKLEAMGAITLPTIAQMSDEQFIAAGISRNIGNRIRAHARKRIR